MNSEISTPLNNDMYTEYADVFSFLFRLSTLKLFRFSLLEMYVYNGKVSTTFAPAENSTFALNGWFMHTCVHSHICSQERKEHSDVTFVMVRSSLVPRQRG